MNGRIALACVLALTYHGNVGGFNAAQVAPNCSLIPVGNEQSFDLHRYRGKVVYVDFWASWCSPCAQSFAFMNDLDGQFRDKGLQVLGINLDERLEDATGFLAKHPPSFTVAFDAGGRCPQDFGVQGMPSSYLVDRKGVIRHVHLGFRRGEAEKLRGLVEQLLAEGSAGH
ncbi:MAG: TlpA disulfide reductase family protein [Gammaproteobacteria bacterium]